MFTAYLIVTAGGLKLCRVLIFRHIKKIVLGICVRIKISKPRAFYARLEPPRRRRSHRRRPQTTRINIASAAIARAARLWIGFDRI
jgi:hypothetical protein